MQPAKSSPRFATRSSSHCASMTFRIRVWLSDLAAVPATKSASGGMLDDMYLIRHQPKDTGDFITVTGRNGPQAQIAGIGIEIHETYEGRSRLDIKCQKVGNLPYQLQWIVAVVETTGNRLVGNGRRLPWSLRQSRRHGTAICRNQPANPFGERVLTAGWSGILEQPALTAEFPPPTEANATVRP